MFVSDPLCGVICSNSVESDILIDTLNPDLGHLVFFSGQIKTIIFGSHQRGK